ncbi:MAG: vWA domain-containing protein, partial [Gemmatimonadota bacterium]|nr:vWA domain-containing protein [Gemmatimonadota bacterium]
MTDLSVSFQAARPLWLALLPLAVLIIAWWTYRRTYPPVNRWYRWLLVILRLAVVALVGLLLFDPALTLKTERSRPERVAVLVDRSASMLLPATREGTGVDSLDRGKAALRFIKSTIERQGGSSRISYFTFGEELTALDSLDPDKILSQVEDRTDLASALKTLLPGSSSRWDRIVVVSDGQVNSGADPAAALAAARAAAPGGSGPVVDAVVVGEPPGLPEELALESVERLGGRVFAGGEIELEVSLAVGRPPMQGTSGAVPSLAVVEVHVNGRLAAQKRIRIGSVEEAWFISSRIKLPAGDPGQKVLRVLVRPLENEWTALNNERLLFVEVASGKRRVLLISNRPDWDFSFLRRALMSNEDWAVESRVVLSPPGDRSLVRGVDPRGRYSAGRLPSRSELDDMELVLLHGELSGFERAFLARVAARVSKGGLGIIFWPIGKISPASLPAVLKGCLPFRGGLPASFLQAPGGQQPSVVFTLGRYNVLAGLGAGAPLENLSPLQWVFPAVPLGKGANTSAP